MLAKSVARSRRDTGAAISRATAAAISPQERRLQRICKRPFNFSYLCQSGDFSPDLSQEPENPRSHQIQPLTTDILGLSRDIAAFFRLSLNSQPRCQSSKSQKLKLAERGGFEPPVALIELQRISNPSLSTTQPPLQVLYLLPFRNIMVLTIA